MLIQFINMKLLNYTITYILLGTLSCCKKVIKIKNKNNVTQVLALRKRKFGFIIVIFLVHRIFFNTTLGPVSFYILYPYEPRIFPLSVLLQTNS